MKQFIPQRMPDESGVLFLTAKEVHYLVSVRRFQEGRVLTLLMTDGTRVQGVLEHHSSESWVVRLVTKISDSSVDVGSHLESHNVSPLESPTFIPEFHLILGYPKGKKLEISLRQATELGVKSIYPVLTDHSVPDLVSKDWEKKQGRLENILREAVNQSNCSWVPTLSKLSTLTDLLSSKPFEMFSQPLIATEKLGIFFHEKPLAQKNLSHYLSSEPKKIFVAIGPEGGFSSKEVQLFLDRGFAPGYLGSTILRCETAVVAALAALKILCLEA